MPSLKTLGRRWMFGGDELSILSVFYYPFRLLQAVALTLATNSYACLTDSSSLQFATAMYLYTIFTLANCALSLVVESLILHFAGMGTPINYKPRQPIEVLIRIKIILLIPLNVAALVTGVAPTFLVSCHETSSLPKLLQVLLFSSQFLETFFTTCCFHALKGRRNDDPGERRRRFGTDHVEAEWENACRFLCSCSAVVTCFLFGGSDSGGGNDYAMIARVLADYFEDGGTLDIVPSDVAAGIVMLRHVQKCREWNHRMSRMQSEDHKDIAILNLQEHANLNEELFGAAPSPAPPLPPITPPTVAIDPTSSPLKSSKYWYRVANRPTLDNQSVLDRLALDEAARFSRHALAIYTWMLYVFMHPITGIPSLSRVRCKLSSPCCCCQCCTTPESESHISADNCCRGHMSALLAQANLDSSEVLYANFSNSIVENPYAVIADHKWRSIVLTIRGTMSLEDCITDALAESIPLEPLGRKYGFDGAGEYAHAGMVLCSEWIMEDLVAHNTLIKAFQEYPTYQLRVTGHSLGAGCAFLLALMLKKQYPDLRCLPYSPPGGLVSMKTARACSEWTTSFVLGSDIVPRLSVDSMEHLRDETLEIIARIKVNKMTVLKSAILGPGGDERLDLMEDLMDDLELPAAESEFNQQLRAFKEVQAGVKRDRGNVDISLYPPGKIIHFVKTEEGKMCGGCSAVGCLGRVCKCIGGRKREYTPMWANNDDFTEIVVSPSMGLDHFPDRVCLSIEGVAESWDIDVNPGSKLSREGGGKSSSSGVETKRLGNESPLSDEPLMYNNAV